MANGSANTHFLKQSYQHCAMDRSADDCLDLGLSYSCGLNGQPVDLIEAHKWFNLAALGGCSEGQAMRTDIAEQMTAGEIAKAQRLARVWIVSTQAHAA